MGVVQKAAGGPGGGVEEFGEVVVGGLGVLVRLLWVVWGFGEVVLGGLGVLVRLFWVVWGFW